MGKPVSGLNVFQNQAGPIPLSQLDTNFTTVTSAQNDTATYSNYFADASGAPNQITVTVSAPLTFAYTTGILLQVRLANTNTSTTVNINVNTLGNKLVILNDGTAPPVGALTAASILDLIYDGTSFRVMSQRATSTITTGLFGDGSAGSPSISFASDPDTGVYHIGANNFGFSTGGTLRGQIDTSGQWGIGVIAPADLFHVAGGGASNRGAVRISDAGGTSFWNLGRDNQTTGNFVLSNGTTTVLNIPPGTSGQFEFLDGSAGTPVISFVNDPDTGFYRPTSNDIAVTAGGTYIADFGIASGGPQFKTADGTTSLPAMTFNADATTGIYRAGAGLIGITTSGVSRAQFGTGLNITGTGGLAVTGGVASFSDGSVGSPGIQFQNDPNTGIFRVGADDVALVAGGGIVIEYSATSINLGVNAVSIGLLNSTAIQINAQSTTTATAGAATLPANPQGFITISINGSSRKIPYYQT